MTGKEEGAGGSAATKEASKRYMREMAIASVLYALVVLAGVYAVSRFNLPAWLVIAAALAPVAPALLMLRAYLVFVRGLDEFQRRVQSEAMLIALATVGFTSFAYGFLEEWAHFPHVPLLWVLPAITAVWGIARFFVSRRYL